MQFIPILIASLTQIGLKMLMTAIGEKQLAKLLFGILSYFASKSATDKDDKLVVWAKSLYDGEDHVQAELALQAPLSSAEFLLKQQNEEIRNNLM